MSENFGDILRDAREKKNISLAQVSEALKLAVEKIEDIENSAVGKLPPAAFTCGYLRLFAKLVSVDEQQVIELYYQSTGEKPDHVPGATSELPTQASSKHLGMRVASFSIVILIVVLTILWWKDKSADEDTVLDKSEIAQSEITNSGQSGVEENTQDLAVNTMQEPDLEVVMKPQEETVVNESSSDKQSLHIVETEQLGQQQTEKSDESDPQPIVSADEEKQSNIVDETESKRQEIIALAKTANPVAEIGVDTVQLNAVDDCWVEVTDANDQLLYFSLLKEGEEVHLSGQEPFKVFLGKAAAVNIKINNLPYDVTPYIRSNQVARFTMSMKNARKNQSSSTD